MNGSVNGPTDGEEVPGSGTSVLVRRIRWDSHWARISQAGRQAKPLETPSQYKIDANPTGSSGSYRDHPWFGALLTESKDKIKVGEELVSPAVLRGLRQSTLSLAVYGSAVHKRPVAEDTINARTKEAVVQKLCPLCSWDVGVEGMVVAAELASKLGKSDIGVQVVSVLTTDTKKFNKVKSRGVVLDYRALRCAVQ